MPVACEAAARCRYDSPPAKVMSPSTAASKGRARLTTASGSPIKSALMVCAKWPSVNIGKNLRSRASGPLRPGGIARTRLLRRSALTLESELCEFHITGPASQACNSRQSRLRRTCRTQGKANAGYLVRSPGVRKNPLLGCRYRAPTQGLVPPVGFAWLYSLMNSWVTSAR